MSDDSPTVTGASNVLLNQRSLTAPYHREPVHIQGDENVGKAIGFDTTGVLTAIAVGGTVVNVRDFGALGNSVADDTAEIQAAVDSLSATGGIVFFPCGRFKLSAPLLLHQGIRLKGEGQSATVLKWNLVNSSLIKSATKGSIAIYHVAIEDLTVDNTSRANAGAIGIDFQDIAISTITSVCVTNVALGVQFASTMPANLAAYYNIMTHADIIECPKAIVFGEAANENKVFGGRIDSSGTPDVGIDIGAVTNVEIQSIASGHYNPIIKVAGLARGIKLVDLYLENAIASGVAIQIDSDNESTLVLAPHFALVGAGFTNLSDGGNSTTMLGAVSGNKIPSVDITTISGNPNLSNGATFNGAAVFNDDLTTTAGAVQFTRTSSGTALTVNNPGSGRAVLLSNNNASLATLQITSSGGASAISTTGGNIENETVGKGFVLKSPDGTRYRIAVANGGALSTTPA